jgi:plastocyanin
MASVLDQQQQTEISPTGVKQSRGGWLRTQAIGAIAFPITMVLVMLRIGEFAPFFIILMAPLIVGLLVRVRFRRTGTTLLGVFGLLLLAMNAPFLVTELQHPEAGIDFMTPVLAVASLGTVLIATIPAYREIKRGASGSRGAVLVPAIAGVLVVALAAVALVSNARYENAVAVAGDIKVEAQDFEFAAPKLVADSGEITVYVENTGDALHSFTIDKLGIDEYVPAGKSARITFTAGPGTYRFYCGPHAPDMEGSLTVK